MVDIVMDGVLCVNKPEGFTSFDVIAKLRGILKMKKLGHSGTLDPMATGVLPVFLGKGTKAISFLPDHDKEYRASFQLGLETDTLDCTGTTLKQHQEKATYPEVKEALGAFMGEHWQLPPMYSAVKKDGVPLYRLAREGKTIERSPRRISIYQLALLSFDEDTQKGSFSVSCSAGTYVRSLCDDLGKALGTGGILTGLVRTKACGFSLNDSLTLEQIETFCREGTINSHVVPVHTLFSGLPALRLSGKMERMFSNGVPLELSEVPNFSGRAAVYGTEMFLGLASERQGKLRVDKLFMEALSEG